MVEEREKRGDGKGEGLVRLNRYLAMCGVASRRHADELIREGQVTVDGEPVRSLGTKVDPGRSRVAVAGRDVTAGRRRYFLFNKPKGVVCTNSPREQKTRAIDFFPRRPGLRLFCVGRLDEDSEGLILVTNDGDFANLVAHPSHGVEKTYSVQIRGQLGRQDLDKIRQGTWLAEGRTAGARVVVRRSSRQQTSLLVTLREGRNREIRRIFARLERPVRRLKRVRIGNLNVHKLKPGAFRPLTREEIEELRRTAAAGGRGTGKGEPWRRSKGKGRTGGGRGPSGRRG